MAQSIISTLVRCPLMAQSGHSSTEFQCPLLGVKRTSYGRAPMSAFDPKGTFSPIPLDANHCCNRLHLSLNRRGPKPRGRTMRRREFISLLGGAVTAWPVRAWGQPSARMRLIGVLLPIAKDDPDYQPWLTA